MKISILQENLKQAVLIASCAAGKNPNLPILSNILIEAKDEIKIISTNLDIGVTTTVRGKIEAPGSFTVDAKKLTDYLALLPNQKTTLEKVDNNLSIVSQNYKTKIIGQSSEEYPVIPQVSQKAPYKLKITEFKKALSQTIFASLISEIRPELAGVLFEVENEKLILAATDSFRLAEKKLKIAQPEEDKEARKIIVPNKTLQELLRIISLAFQGQLEEDQDELEFYLADNQILFKSQNTQLVSRLIEGQYPDYKQIIPEAIRSTAAIDKEEFARAIKTSALFARTSAKDINLEFLSGKNKVIVSASSGQAGENITEVEAGATGVDNGIVVNYRYILDALAVIDSENIRLELIDNNTPCILKGDGDASYLYVIMPIRQ